MNQLCVLRETGAIASSRRLLRSSPTEPKEVCASGQCAPASAANNEPALCIERNWGKTLFVRRRVWAKVMRALADLLEKAGKQAASPLIAKQLMSIKANKKYHVPD
jgi:hypothetical protein